MSRISMQHNILMEKLPSQHKRQSYSFINLVSYLQAPFITVLAARAGLQPWPLSSIVLEQQRNGGLSNIISREAQSS
jgi:hypothetical protein